MARPFLAVGSPGIYPVGGLVDALAPVVSNGVTINAGTVVDLTGRMGADGSIDGTPPKGNWRIIRLGWTLTGKTNHPAPAEATPIEIAAGQ